MIEIYKADIKQLFKIICFICFLSSLPGSAAEPLSGFSGFCASTGPSGNRLTRFCSRCAHVELGPANLMTAVTFCDRDGILTQSFMYEAVTGHSLELYFRWTSEGEAFFSKSSAAEGAKIWEKWNPERGGIFEDRLPDQTVFRLKWRQNGQGWWFSLPQISDPLIMTQHQNLPQSCYSSCQIVWKQEDDAEYSLWSAGIARSGSGWNHVSSMNIYCSACAYSDPAPSRVLVCEPVYDHSGNFFQFILFLDQEAPLLTWLFRWTKDGCVFFCTDVSRLFTEGWKIKDDEDLWKKWDSSLPAIFDDGSFKDKQILSQGKGGDCSWSQGAQLMWKPEDKSWMFSVNGERSCIVIPQPENQRERYYFGWSAGQQKRKVSSDSERRMLLNSLDELSCSADNTEDERPERQGTFHFDFKKMSDLIFSDQSLSSSCVVSETDAADMGEPE